MTDIYKVSVLPKIPEIEIINFQWTEEGRKIIQDLFDSIYLESAVKRVWEMNERMKRDD